MTNKAYWEDVVSKLTSKEKANWAAHVIAREYSINCVNAKLNQQF